LRGLDTNIVLRIFDRTDARQSIAVDHLLASSAQGEFRLNPIVLSELAWTLKRKYKKSREVIAAHLELLVESPEFTVISAEEAQQAVRDYRNGPADFADYFLAAINLNLGCATTLTFDEDAAKGESYTLLKA
jgi:predicted nucleic-acid-binding protein